LKLKKDESRAILETVWTEVISDQLERLEAKLEESRKRANEQSDSEDDDVKGFLQAIDLISEEEQSKVLEDADEPEGDQSKPWTLLYHALMCIEKLVENQDKRFVVTMLAKLGLPKAVLVFAKDHQNYWIRMISQRLIGHIFAAQIELKGNLTQMLGLDIPEQLESATYDLVSCLNKQVCTSELKE